MIPRILRSVALLATVGLASQQAIAADSQLSCQGEGTYFVTNQSGARIGNQEFGFGTESECETAIATLHGNVVCSWNGWTYQTYNAETGDALGGTGPKNYFKSLSDCGQDSRLQPEGSPFACAWNGKFYSPVSRAGNRQLSAALNGWNTGKECVEETASKATKLSVCGWDGKAYLYLLDGIQIPFQFSSMDSCNSFQRALEASKRFGEVLERLAGPELDSPGVALAIKDGEPDSKVGFTEWKKCEVRSLNFHLAKSENGFLVPACTPDTVYSWGGYEKLQWFKENLPNRKSWPDRLPRGLFTTLSAAATFGYGDVPLRIRLKPDVRFRVVGDYEGTCDKVVERGFATEAQLKTTGFARVVVRGDGFSFMEYLICSPNLIQSWSFGTAEHFDEIVRDHRWMTTESYYNWEGYSKREGKDDFIGNNVDAEQYATKFTQSSYNYRMAILRVLATERAGGVFSPSGADPKHFSTQRPIYFNPN